VTEADHEANRYHLEALVGGRTRWREHVEQTKILDVQWDKLPLSFRQKWWQATDYGQHPPSPEFAARMPELLAIDQTKLENDKREIAADTARAHEFLIACWRLQPPLHDGRVDHLGRRCEQCLRPASPCKVRCLRLMLHETDTAKVEALDTALRIALPRLVHETVEAFKKALPPLLADLSDGEWNKLRDDEDRRRGRPI
jgi:hypothetical protein